LVIYGELENAEIRFWQEAVTIHDTSD